MRPNFLASVIILLSVAFAGCGSSNNNSQSTTTTSATLSASSFNFGNNLVNNTLTQQVVTVTNTGSSALTLSPAITGTKAARPTMVRNEARTISPSATGRLPPSSDGRLDCSDAKFAMPASFARMRCTAAVFSDTEFARPVSFEGAYFAEMFFLYKTIFRDRVLVEGAQFPYDIDWSAATLAFPTGR